MRPRIGGSSLALLPLLLPVAGAACAPEAGAPPAASGEAEPYWSRSWDRIRDEVEAVRAGRDLTPGTWPGGARVAVLLSFDVDNETLALDPSGTSIGELSQGEYGARRGLPRVVDVLERHGVPATFFVPAVSLRLAPEQVGRIRDSGPHEFAVHGWVHETNASLDSATERTLVERAVSDLEELTGVRPVGYRAPSWNFSPHTLDIVRDLGFLYDSSLMADDRPYEIVSDGEPTGVVELPVEWILDDYPLLMPLGDRYAPPDEVLEVWTEEFDVAYREGTIFLLTLHPHVIGHRSRIGILDRLIEHIRGHEDVWFATHRRAAEHVSRGM